MEATKLSPASKRTLILHFPDGEVRHVVVEKALTTIGRLAANDIVIDHPTVSRKHARLALVKGELFIEDLGAANPTMLDGKPLTPHEPVELTPATQLQIGSIEMRVVKAPQAVAEAQTILHPPAGVEQVKAKKGGESEAGEEGLIRRSLRRALQMKAGQETSLTGFTVPTWL